MARYKFLKISSPVIAVMLMLPAASWADMNYTFIKMTCDKETKTASIKVFYDWNDSGKARAERHEKDTYYLDEVHGKEITCNLGNNQSVGFIAHGGTNTPKKNYLGLYLNHIHTHAKGESAKAAWGISLAQGAWEYNIRQTGMGQYDVRFCSKERYFFAEYSRKAISESVPLVCRDTKFIKGELIESHVEEQN
jgi:hypothetical protein